MKTNYNKEILASLDRIIGLLEITKTIIDLKNNTALREPQEDLIKLEMKDYMTAQYLFDECKKKFQIKSYIELSDIVSDRKGNYTVYFKNNQEADEENKNKSAQDLEKEGIKGITLEERLLMELVYFEKHGKHLDVDNFTLCSGSRDCHGGVPRVDFDSGLGGVYVYWYSVGSCYNNLRARSVVKIEK